VYQLDQDLAQSQLTPAQIRQIRLVVNDLFDSMNKEPSRALLTWTAIQLYRTRMLASEDVTVILSIFRNDIAHLGIAIDRELELGDAAKIPQVLLSIHDQRWIHFSGWPASPFRAPRFYDLHSMNYQDELAVSPVEVVLYDLARLFLVRHRRALNHRRGQPTTGTATDGND
jgi:hypothetical protein